MSIGYFWTSYWELFHPWNCINWNWFQEWALTLRTKSLFFSTTSNKNSLSIAEHNPPRDKLSVAHMRRGRGCAGRPRTAAVRRPAPGAPRPPRRPRPPGRPWPQRRPRPPRPPRAPRSSPAATAACAGASLRDGEDQEMKSALGISQGARVFLSFSPLFYM